MVDDINSESQGSAPDPAKPQSPIVAFLGSPTGRLVVGGIALFVVLVAAGAVAFFFLLNQGQQAPTTTPRPKPSSTTTTVTATPVNPPEAPLKDTFTFRNVFIPTVHPAEPETSTATSSTTSGSNETSGSGTSSSDEQTLVLEMISMDSGTRVATFTWAGTTYQVSAGAQIGSSPWKVLEIYSDSALMLYGDSRITLSVGQGFTTETGTISK